MATFFAAEVGVMLWILSASSLFNSGSLLAFIEIFIIIL